MMLFRVDRTKLTVEVFTDPTAKINNSSVWLAGKRRDRVTDRYIWFDDTEDALAEQYSAITKKVQEINVQIVELTRTADQLQQLPVSTKKALNTAIQQYNNDSFFD